MTHAMIEHVNLTVSNPEQTADMLSDLFGWHIRWSGPGGIDGRTIHVGSEHHYLAVYAGSDGDGAPAGFQKGLPLNHVGSWSMTSTPPRRRSSRAAWSRSVTGTMRLAAASTSLTATALNMK
jgi:catechol 2,3-dioxygenase-like lactoylglutathione lyase family enzyme